MIELNQVVPVVSGVRATFIPVAELPNNYDSGVKLIPSGTGNPGKSRKFDDTPKQKVFTLTDDLEAIGDIQGTESKINEENKEENYF